jgi:hypothetical protein
MLFRIPPASKKRKRTPPKGKKGAEQKNTMKN